MGKAAVFSCMGLGDGLIALILSNNLNRNKIETTTYHPFLSGLQSWFPHLPLKPFPSSEEMEQMLRGYDQLFIIFEKSPWMKEVMEWAKRIHPSTTYILNPIATKNRNVPYWEVGQFDGNIPFGNNLLSFCDRELHLTDLTLHNGIIPDPHCTFKKYPNRVAIHPTSSRAGKNWPEEKYLELIQRLKQDGLEGVFLLSEKEARDWKSSPSVTFTSMLEGARFVYESGFMIGNDSGIGHLASCLGIPTLTVCRSHKTAAFWRPCWADGKIVHPPSWLPNAKFLRLRDKYWKQFVSVSRVHRSFCALSLPE